jgi:hypothetical protein
MPSIEALAARIESLRLVLTQTRALYSSLFNLGLHNELVQVHIIQHDLQVRIEQLEIILQRAKDKDSR